MNEAEISRQRTRMIEAVIAATAPEDPAKGYGFEEECALLEALLHVAAVSAMRFEQLPYDEGRVARLATALKRSLHAATTLEKVRN